MGNHSKPLDGLDLLAVMLIGLKLAGLITWSWLWVLAPIWGTALFLTVMFLIGLLTAGRSKR